MARPLSADTVAIMAALVDGPGTSRELATRAGVAVDLAMRALDNMARRDEVAKLQPVRRPGVKRPVPVYARAGDASGQDDDEAAQPGGMVDLIAAWAGLLPGVTGINKGSTHAG